jgi:hypothetical protein
MKPKPRITARARSAEATAMPRDAPTIVWVRAVMLPSVTPIPAGSRERLPARVAMGKMKAA